MCGIAGMGVSVDQPSPSGSLGWRLIEVIGHHGPDDDGLHRDERATLGMRGCLDATPAGT